MRALRSKQGSRRLLLAVGAAAVLAAAATIPATASAATLSKTCTTTLFGGSCTVNVPGFVQLTGSGLYRALPITGIVGGRTTAQGFSSSTAACGLGTGNVLLNLRSSCTATTGTVLANNGSVTCTSSGIGVLSIRTDCVAFFFSFAD